VLGVELAAVALAIGASDKTAAITKNAAA